MARLCALILVSLLATSAAFAQGQKRPGPPAPPPAPHPAPAAQPPRMAAPPPHVAAPPSAHFAAPPHPAPHMAAPPHPSPHIAAPAPRTVPPGVTSQRGPSRMLRSFGDRGTYPAAGSQVHVQQQVRRRAPRGCLTGRKPQSRDGRPGRKSIACRACKRRSRMSRCVRSLVSNSMRSRAGTNRGRPKLSGPANLRRTEHQARITPQAAVENRFAGQLLRDPAHRDRWMQARREHWAPAEAWRHKVRAAFVPWFGPVFWPYAYSDVFDYTFWPYAYDESYWAFVYDNFFDGIFFPYGAPYVGDAYTGPYGGYGYAEQYDPGANVYYGSRKAAPTIGRYQPDGSTALRRTRFRHYCLAHSTDRGHGTAEQ